MPHCPLTTPTPMFGFEPASRLFCSGAGGVEAEHWMPAGFGCEVRQRAVLAHVEVGADGARVLRQVAFEDGCGLRRPQFGGGERLGGAAPAERDPPSRPARSPPRASRPRGPGLGPPVLSGGYRSC